MESSTPQALRRKKSRRSADGDRWRDRTELRLSITSVPAPSRANSLDVEFPYWSQVQLRFAPSWKSDVEQNLHELYRRTVSIRVGARLIRVPSNLTEIAKAIERSQRLVSFEENWDCEGGLGYSTETWQRAAIFLAESACALLKVSTSRVPTPTIGPGPNGSFDILWKTKGRYLLVNIRGDDEPGIAGFYGDDGNGNLAIEGTFDVTTPQVWLLMWLVGQ